MSAWSRYKLPLLLSLSLILGERSGKANIVLGARRRQRERDVLGGVVGDGDGSIAELRYCGVMCLGIWHVVVCLCVCVLIAG